MTETNVITTPMRRGRASGRGAACGIPALLIGRCAGVVGASWADDCAASHRRPLLVRLHHRGGAQRCPTPGGAAAARRCARHHRGTVCHLRILLGIVTVFVVRAAIYCLDALNGERKERSIPVSGRSLPVSDRTTVLAKFAVPMLVLPALTWCLTVVLHVLMLATGVAIMGAHGVNIPALLGALPLGTIWTGFLYALAIIALCVAPIYAWLLLVRPGREGGSSSGRCCRRRRSRWWRRSASTASTFCGCSVIAS